MAAMNYGRWILLFRMPNGCGKRVWELSKPEGICGFCGLPCFRSEVRRRAQTLNCVGGVQKPSRFPEPLTYWAHLARLGEVSKSRK